MGYLGLSDPVEKQDNLFQRVFWPSDDASSVDMLGQQGFWICAGIAVISFLLLLVQGHWVIGILTFAFLVLGGIGVREHSTAAAILVAGAYLLNLVAGAFIGVPPGILAIALAMLLLANIRGTWIAARWMKRGDPEEFPRRMSETWSDRLVDQMPARVWPKAKILFYCLALVYIGLAVLGTVALARRQARPPVQQPAAGQVINVAPGN